MIKYFSENLYNPYTTDLCINCKDPKPISDFAYLEYQDGKIEAGPTRIYQHFNTSGNQIFCCVCRGLA